MVGARIDDMVAADELANELQFLLKTKWTIDEDKYNSDAFDQCEGAWPIAHPLPLPLWSNTIKQPFIVENVRYFTLLYLALHCFTFIFITFLKKKLLSLISQLRYGNMKILLD